MRILCLALILSLVVSLSCKKVPPPVSPTGLSVPIAQEQTISQSVAKAINKSHQLRVAANTPPPQKETMDALEVETDTETTDWVVGKTGIIRVIIAEPTLIASAGQLKDEVEIGTTSVPVSAYYLVALDGALPGQFIVAPAPGQQERQHRAPQGYPATWRYEVTPLGRGPSVLIFTLKVFGENDSAGTAISTRPLHLNVTSKFPSSTLFSINHFIVNGPGWAAVLGVVAALITALAYSTWWRSNHKSRKKQMVSKD
jgi:hypothetical protein